MLPRKREYQKPACCVADNSYQDRVFEQVADERSRIMGALFDAQDYPHWRIVNRMASCCRDPIVLKNHDLTEVRLSERRCRSRCCPRCRRFRAREIQHRLMAACRSMNSTRFLTLTMASCDESLRDQLQALRDSFARLRRDKFWRSRVLGGVYCVEVTWSTKLRQWHPHLHAVIDGDYLPKSGIVESWKKASRGSYIVDIQFVHSASRVASYVAKYVSKSDDASNVPDHKIAEWAVAVHGLRLVHSFGNLHGVVLVEKPEYAKGVSIEVINPVLLASASKRGDMVARSILQSLDSISCGMAIDAPDHLLDRITCWETWCRLDTARLRALEPIPPPPDPTTLF